MPAFGVHTPVFGVDTPVFGEDMAVFGVDMTVFGQEGRQEVLMVPHLSEDRKLAVGQVQCVSGRERKSGKSRICR